MGGSSTWRLQLAQAATRFRTDVTFAAVDALIVASAYSAALLMRFLDVALPTDWLQRFLLVLPLAVVVHPLANFIFGAYGHVWEYASVEEAMRLVGASLFSLVTLLGFVFTLQWVTEDSLRLVPLLVLLAGTGLSLSGMGIVRFRSRLFSFKRLESIGSTERALVVGTGRAAADLGRRTPTVGAPLEVVGFISPDDRKTVRRLAGRPILGGVHQVRELVEREEIRSLVICDSVDEDVIRRLVDDCVDLDVTLRLLHETDISGNGSRSLDLRDLELSDLLPRPVVAIDLEEVRGILEGRTVLVTGAGGSIGSEIVAQLLSFPVRSVVALDHDETHLHDAGLRWSMSPTPAVMELCDVRDAGGLAGVFERHRPDVVFHAAALKHVPMLEQSPEEAVKTNVMGTAHLLDLARQFTVERFVLISTDKAVQPVSVMGASKRMAEMLVQVAQATSDTGCHYSAVRFGNVLGSRGSVIPTFVYQIRNGGPLTVSNPEMLRYFMTTAEAVSLVLQASALAAGGEILVLDMGEPVRVGDLARRMIRLAGLVPGRDIEMRVTGVRPGEKMAESVSDAPLLESSHPKIGVARPGHPGSATMRDATQALSALAASGDRGELARLLLAMARPTWTADEVVDLTEMGYRTAI